MTDFCLLIFSRNSNNDVLRLTRKLTDYVDEIVVIDSSDNQIYDELRSAITSEAKVFRVFPTGSNDISRPYASTKIESEYVLNLDCDEDVNGEFIERFRNFDRESAYLLGWRHMKLGEKARKLALYRNRDVKWIGHIFESPVVSGKTVDISHNLEIIHRADFEGGYLKEQGRQERYFFLESLQRQSHVCVPLRRASGCHLSELQL